MIAPTTDIYTIIIGTVTTTVSNSTTDIPSIARKSVNWLNFNAL